MGLYGNLDMMSIRKLLGWIDAGKKTGTLEVERKKVGRRLGGR